MRDQDPELHSIARRTKWGQFVVALGGPRMKMRNEVFVDSSAVRTTVVGAGNWEPSGKMLGITLASFALVAGGLAWLSSRSIEAASTAIALGTHTEFAAASASSTVLLPMALTPKTLPLSSTLDAGSVTPTP